MAQFACRQIPVDSIPFAFIFGFMAWRIHDSVIRGEIDNRVKGIVRGRVWLTGLAEPITLELKGNACPDLAGCLLTFENPGEKFPLPTDDHLASLQRGDIGDLTASRKVRVPDVPLEEFIRLRKARQPAPEHMANCLYLEWFSEANGRVVIESADYKLILSPPAWTLTPVEDEQRARDAAAGFAGFLQKLSDALEAQRHKPPEGKAWDEFDYEKLMRESDARTDKYIELLDKYDGHPDADRLIAEEMGWNKRSQPRKESSGGEGGEPEKDEEEKAFTDADDDDEPFDAEEMNRLCAEAANEPLVPEPTTEGVDWVRDEDGDISHPLSLRAFNSSQALWHQCDELDLVKGADDDLCRLISEFQITGAKLAGALDGLAYGRDRRDGAFTVAYLKRALGHLHSAQAALEKVAPKNLLPAEVLATARKDLFEIREEILRLMEEFRGEK